MSRQNFYLREFIVKFILEQGCTPVSAFMMFSYFLLDSVERKKLIDANNDLVEISDEVWVFGEISQGVAEEVKLARSLGKSVKCFSIKAVSDLASDITFDAIEPDACLV